MKIKSHIDLFSGIGGFSCPKTKLSVEIDKHCRAVQRFHNPKLEFINDIKKVSKSKVAFQPDIITGGFPCQDISVAGQRAGLAGGRSGLWFEFARIIADFKPAWVVIENVPGLQSSSAGNDLAAILGWLGKCGYWWAYRVLDSQYWGVAQRRKRVFIVASLGSRSCVKVLFESEGLPWNPKTSREAGEGFAADVAPSPNASGRGVSRAGESRGQDPVIAIPGRAACLTKKDCKGPDSDTKEGHLIPVVAHTLRAEADASEDGTGRGTPLVVARESGQGYWMEDDKAGPIRCEGENRPSRPSTLACYPIDTRNALRDPDKKDAINRQGCGLGNDGDPSPTLTDVFTPAIAFSCKDNGQDASDKAPTLRSMNYDESHLNGGGQVAAVGQFGVRRLTPRECERLQGFTDDWTKYGRKSDGTIYEISDSQRYRMLGNAVTRTVGKWINSRIMGR